MCGFGGKLCFDDRPDSTIAEAMNRSMHHRGPDAEGVYASGPAFLAHRRLSILDLSDAGRQPMSNSDDDIHIVFNGEIYNYQDLKSDLGSYQFTSETDTEVLLHLYEEEGVDCLERLRGMFAFGIWDERRDRLFLARDRLGQKPLFYRDTEDGFLFGSTIGTILADPAVDPVADERAIRSYLTHQYVPSPRTGFETIRQLNPGEYLLIDDNGVTAHPYWELSFGNQFDATPSSMAQRLRSKLQEATKLRMRSDVPLGVFLSGGIDSSIVTALCAQEANEPIETYTIGFEDERFDEREYARLVADEFDTDHTTHIVTPESMLESIDELLQHYQMPIGDTSILPTYHVSKLASTDITVALNGDGGDEAFAGYDRFRHERIGRRLSTIPKPVRTAGKAIVNRMPPSVRHQRMVRLATRALEITDSDPVVRHARLVCDMWGEDVDALWHGEQPDDEFAAFREAFDAADGSAQLNRLLAIDYATNLPDRLLAKVDRASMAHSLELRSPFLDHEVVQLAAQMPAEFKLKRGEGKWILKQAFSDMLPEQVLDRPKAGFGVPIDNWVRGPLKQMAASSLSELGDRPAFDGNTLRQLLNDHLDGRADNGNVIWDLIMLSKWYKKYIEE